MTDIETLVSLPPAGLRAGSAAVPGAAFAGGDPPGRQLGSGGGTAHLLCEAWRALAPQKDPLEWLAASRKLVIHASGQSRRLPAYAALGKSRLPLPPLDGVGGQSPGQTLLSLQQTAFAHLLRHAPASYRLAVACGDTLVRYDRAMPAFPEADVLIVGIPSSPEEASGHGVLFSPVREPGAIEFFLQKPSPARIRELAADYTFSLDSGVWLLSERAVRVLLAKCGWDGAARAFAGGAAAPYDLYDRFGTALGRNPADPDPDAGALSSAVLALDDGRFYHFGTNRSVIGSAGELAHPAGDRRSFGNESAADGRDRIVLHADAPAVPGTVRPLWIENASVPATWTLAGEHVLTGLPPNAWTVSLPRGVCVDAVGFAGAAGEALRVYGFDDPFKGRLADPATTYLGAPFAEWLAARALTFEEAGLNPAADIQDAPLFPLVDWSDPAGGELLRWMAAPPADPAAAAAARDRWLAARRVSATDLVQRGDPSARLARLDARLGADFAAQTPAQWAAAALRLDLGAAARDFPAAPAPLPAAAGLPAVHDAMFRGAEDDAFSRLRELLVGDMALQPADPRRDLAEDQIVWSRAPARLDLAGGWSDTPPYCLERGGRVVNVAVDLNGQPPIQAFARVCAGPKIVLRSIDLGVSEEIATFEELCSPSRLGAFSIPRAALRLAGFDPRFRGGRGHATLEAMLRERFGGGLELTTLCAIPKGSGLGTSSILAATVLGAVSDACALGWTHRDLVARTIVLEQLLGSGGGWQDQVGGLFPGAKLAATEPGLRQAPDVRFLPDAPFADLFASGRALLYYTGVTRVARNILAQIVKNLFLGDRATLGLIRDIALNADFAADAAARADEAAIAEALRRSWALNRELDSGTCPPSVAPIVAVMEKHGAALKLLGAGGGGYLLALAPDAAAAAAIRADLSRDPPNPRARFVAPSLSRGLQVTRS
ncbi:MAG: bifunctional fucokinase/L-fucose-1-P-guanylyltransferase [Kiritimatiellae bacterium]|nr:bifunctional fucokinase/L-fucose-1-P-guanylyltransferase [Kiritimatiellia bacterium]